MPGGLEHRVGSGDPSYVLTFRTDRTASLPLDDFRLGKAYIDGELDIDGDMAALLDVRDHLADATRPAHVIRFLWQLMVVPATRVNAAAVNYHYTLGDDFYLSFIDSRYRFYSHCLFPTGAESLEDAAERKLESIWQGLQLKPGMRLLDIGGGWGGVTQYCSPRGVPVTSLTLTDGSANYIRHLIDDQRLEGEVSVQDFLTYRPTYSFDGAAALGVIEHIPQYRRFCQRLWDVLEPGGLLYLDASATKQKWDSSAFVRQYVWPGTHSFLSLHDIVRELLLNGFEVMEVKVETRDYARTMRHWADRFEDAHASIAQGWGERQYRLFRMYLRGGQNAFERNRLQAYHLVARRLVDPGPRPGAARRVRQCLATFG